MNTKIAQSVTDKFSEVLNSVMHKGVKLVHDTSVYLKLNKLEGHGMDYCNNDGSYDYLIGKVYNALTEVDAEAEGAQQVCFIVGDFYIHPDDVTLLTSDEYEEAKLKEKEVKETLC